MPTYAQRRDTSEDEILAVAIARGWAVTKIPTGPGFDVLLSRDNVHKIAEIKKPKTRNNLTANEERMREKMQDTRCEYPIIATPEEMEQFLNDL